MKFSDRLKALGFTSYADYLASDTWKTFKQNYRASGARRTCLVCESKPVQLHHHTYQRLGSERIDDVSPLCRLHHEAVHAWLKSSGRVFVEYTHEAIVALGGAPLPRSAKKKQKEKKPPKTPKTRWGTTAACPNATTGGRVDVSEVVERLRRLPLSKRQRKKVKRFARRGELEPLEALFKRVTASPSANGLAAAPPVRIGGADAETQNHAERGAESARRAKYEVRKRSAVSLINAAAEPDRDSARWKAFLAGRKDKGTSAVPV